MSKSLGNYVGVTEPPGGDVRQADARPRRRDGHLLRAAARRGRRSEQPAGGAKRALARRIVERFHGPRRRPRRPRRTSTACTRTTGRPRRSRRSTLSRATSPTASVHLPALLADHFGISRSEARRLLGQGGVRLDGEPLGDGRARRRRRSPRRRRPAGRDAASSGGFWSALSRSAASRRRPPAIAISAAVRLRGGRSPGRRFRGRISVLHLLVALEAVGGASSSTQTERRLEDAASGASGGLSVGEAFFGSRPALGGSSREALRSLKTKQHVRSERAGSLRAGLASDRVQVRPRRSGGSPSRPFGEQNKLTRHALVPGVRAPTERDDSSYRQRSRWAVPSGAGRRMTRKSFTESLILAQDERWRRA